MQGSFQTDRDVTYFGKHFEVAPWSAAKMNGGLPSICSNSASMFRLTL
jgi:hypothetical protein